METAGRSGMWAPYVRVRTFVGHWPAPKITRPHAASDAGEERRRGRRSRRPATIWQPGGASSKPHTGRRGGDVAQPVQGRVTQVQQAVELAHLDGGFGQLFPAQ